MKMSSPVVAVRISPPPSYLSCLQHSSRAATLFEGAYQLTLTSTRVRVAYQCTLGNASLLVEVVERVVTLVTTTLFSVVNVNESFATSGAKIYCALANCGSTTYLFVILFFKPLAALWSPKTACEEFENLSNRLLQDALQALPNETPVVEELRKKLASLADTRVSVTAAKSNLDQLRNQCTAKQNELNTLRGDLAEVISKLGALVLEKTRLSLELEKLNTQKTNLEGQIPGLKAMVLSLETQKAGLENALMLANQWHEEKGMQLRELEQKYGEKRDKLAQFLAIEQRFETLEEDVTKSQKTIASLELQYTALLQLHQKAEAELETKKTEKAKLENEIAKLIPQKEALEKDKNALTPQVADLKAKQEEHKKLTDEIAALTLQRTTLKDTEDALVLESAMLQGDFEELEKQVKTLQSDLQSAQNALTAAKQEKKETDESIATLKGEIVTLTETKQQTEENLKKLGEQASTTQTLVDSLTREKGELEKQLEALKTKNNSGPTPPVNTDVNVLQDEINKLSEATKTLKTEKSNLADVVKLHEESLKALETKESSLNTRLDQMKLEKESKEKEIEKLAEQKQAYDKWIQALLAQGKTLKQENKVAKDALDSMTTGIKKNRRSSAEATLKGTSPIKKTAPLPSDA
jgi:chromosome segregation ATPase